MVWKENAGSFKKKRQVEPTTKYKYLTVASGATPIGSAGRAPDEIKIE
jgi:hypothetical protein